MKRVAVSSSNLRSVGYDESTQILEVEFHSGGVYQYFNVPANVHIALMSAPSHGRYLAYNIRNRYRYRRI